MPIRLARRWLRRRLAERFDLPEIPRALARLRRQGFIPGTIYDVGAYRGDFARDCLAVWPQAQITCFEPLPHMQEALRQFTAETGQASPHEVLLGAEVADAVKFYHGETDSSALLEHGRAPDRPYIMRRQTTVDTVAQGAAVDFLKMDVQGFELEVLKGATATLPRIQVILAELHLLEIHIDVPLMHEVLAWLAERNFVAFDICGFVRRPKDRALWTADIILTRADGPLRASKDYQ